MKFRILIILLLLISSTPNAHAGKPSKKTIQKLLGITSETTPPSKPRGAAGDASPGASPHAPRSPGSTDSPGGGRGLGEVDDSPEAKAVDDIIEEFRLKPFGGRLPLGEHGLPIDGVDLPTDIVDGGTVTIHGGNIEIQVDFPERKSTELNDRGAMKDRQIVKISPKSPEYKERLRRALNDWFTKNEMPLIPDPKKIDDIKPTISPYFHNFVDPSYGECFGIDIRFGGKEFKVILPKGRNVGPAVRIDPDTGDISINPEVILLPKKDYDMIKDKKHPRMRFGPDGAIEIDGIPYGDSHWRPGNY